MSDYKSYIENFIFIKDAKIKKIVDNEFLAGRLWPEPLILFNPTFEKGTSINQLTKNGIFDSRLNDVFKGFGLYKHQV